MTIQSSFPDDRPFADFKHCPRCGATRLCTHAARAIRCDDCNFILYFNCATAAAAFIVHQGMLLLGVRGKDPQQGMLDFPGGFVEFDETAEDALAREVQEEFNLTILSPIYLTSSPNDYRYAGVLYKTTDLYFICNVDDISSIRAMDDVADYLWMAPKDIKIEKLAFASGRTAFLRLLEFLNRPSYLLHNKS